MSWSAPANTCAPLAAPATQAGTPPPAAPSAAAADTPPTPEAQPRPASRANADAIAAAAAALRFGWVPDPDDLTGTVYASSNDAPFTEEIGPELLLDFCRKRLCEYVMDLSSGGGALAQASSVYVTYVGMPFALPLRSKNFVSAAARVTGCGPDSADLPQCVHVQ